LIVAGDHNLDINRSNPLVRDVLYRAYDISSVETDNLQRTDLTDSITNDSEEAPLEIAESSEQPLATMTASVSSLANLNKDGLMMDISKLTTVTERSPLEPKPIGSPGAVRPMAEKKVSVAAKWGIAKTPRGRAKGMWQRGGPEFFRGRKYLSATICRCFWRSTSHTITSSQESES
jgi:hypothetical protein